MHLKQLMKAVVALLLLSQCQPKEPATSETTEDKPVEQPMKETPKKAATPFVQAIESAHNKAGFLSKAAIRFQLELWFGGSKRLDGTLTLLTNSSKGMIEQSDGNTIIFSGDTVFYSPALENERRVRFDAYTWPYFFMLSHKLSDTGTKWEDFAKKELNGKTYAAEKLTFDPGTGDAPDDWYILYADPSTNLVEVTAYIVTFGGSQEEAEADPHAIQYKAYQEVQGVPFATEWVFWEWREAEGLTRELGKATLSNFEFLDAVEITAPVDFKVLN